MEKESRRVVNVTLFLLALMLGIALGVLLDRNGPVAAAQFGAPPSSAPNLGLINDAWNIIEREYVDRSALQSDTLTYAAINGMVNALGDTGHSTFLTPQMVKQERNFTQGSFEGIGAQVEKKDNHVVIVAPMDDSPAQRAGLKPGDLILKIDNQDMTGASVEEVVSRILGPAGSSVSLTIGDAKTGSHRSVVITRARIILRNVTWQRLPGTTYADLRIGGFSQGVTSDLQKALEDIKNQGMTGIILDLRNNPGGLLDEAIGAGSQFLSKGNILLVKDSRGQTTSIAAKPGGVAYEMPMVVLINGGTASAAEIVAGAIQDSGRAQLVGDTTFGTGTVLNEFNLADGSALLLAVQEWLTPNGRVIWHRGIVPDVQVSLPTGVVGLTPGAVQDLSPTQLSSSEDAQLNRAIQMLK